MAAQQKESPSTEEGGVKEGGVEMPPPQSQPRKSGKENAPSPLELSGESSKETPPEVLTPAVAKTKKLRGAHVFNSPSDAIQSPFSQKLNNPRHHAGFLNDKPPPPFNARPKRLQDLVGKK